MHFIDPELNCKYEMDQLETLLHPLGIHEINQSISLLHLDLKTFRSLKSTNHNHSIMQAGQSHWVIHLLRVLKWNNQQEEACRAPEVLLKYDR